jgi:hypothetical protein
MSEKLIDRVKSAKALYEKCGVDGENGARLMEDVSSALIAADRLAETVGIEWTESTLADFEAMEEALAAYRKSTEASK